METLLKFTFKTDTIESSSNQCKTKTKKNNLKQIHKGFTYKKVVGISKYSDSSLSSSAPLTDTSDDENSSDSSSTSTDTEISSRLLKHEESKRKKGKRKTLKKKKRKKKKKYNIIISKIKEGSLARELGLKEGDEIIELEGGKVFTCKQLRITLKNFTKDIEILVKRFETPFDRFQRLKIYRLEQQLKSCACGNSVTFVSNGQGNNNGKVDNAENVEEDDTISSQKAANRKTEKQSTSVSSSEYLEFVKEGECVPLPLTTIHSNATEEVRNHLTPSLPRRTRKAPISDENLPEDWKREKTNDSGGKIIFRHIPSDQKVHTPRIMPRVLELLKIKDGKKQKLTVKEAILKAKEEDQLDMYLYRLECLDEAIDNQNNPQHRQIINDGDGDTLHACGIYSKLMDPDEGVNILKGWVRKEFEGGKKSCFEHTESGEQVKDLKLMPSILDIIHREDHISVSEAHAKARDFQKEEINLWRLIRNHAENKVTSNDNRLFSGNSCNDLINPRNVNDISCNEKIEKTNSNSSHQKKRYEDENFKRKDKKDNLDGYSSKKQRCNGNPKRNNSCNRNAPIEYDSERSFDYGMDEPRMSNRSATKGNESNSRYQHNNVEANWRNHNERHYNQVRNCRHNESYTMRTDQYDGNHNRWRDQHARSHSENNYHNPRNIRENNIMRRDYHENKDYGAGNGVAAGLTSLNTVRSDRRQHLPPGWIKEKDQYLFKNGNMDVKVSFQQMNRLQKLLTNRSVNFNTALSIVREESRKLSKRSNNSDVKKNP